MKRMISALTATFLCLSLFAARPQIWGIARMTFLVSSPSVAQDYYGNFLGFEKAFSYSGRYGRTLCYKVSDRQFLEFVVSEEAKTLKNRLLCLSLETESVVAMVEYLRGKGVDICDPQDDGAGNLVTYCTDTHGNTIEFIEFCPKGRHAKDAGRHLGKNRISTRIHHAGLPSSAYDAEDAFWVKVLGTKVLFSVENKIIYYGFVQSTESVENYFPPQEDFAHPCFLTEDMEQTLQELRRRGGAKMIAAPAIGATGRWILNLTNPDGTKVEFTESKRYR